MVGFEQPNPAVAGNGTMALVFHRKWLDRAVPDPHR